MKNKIILMAAMALFLTGCGKTFGEADIKIMKESFGKYEVVKEDDKLISIKYLDVSKEERKITIDKKKDVETQVINESTKILTEKHQAYLNGYFGNNFNKVTIELYDNKDLNYKDFIPSEYSFFAFNRKATYIFKYEFKDVKNDEIVKYFKEVSKIASVEVNAIVNGKYYYIDTKKVTAKNINDYKTKLKKNNA